MPSASEQKHDRWLFSLLMLSIIGFALFKERYSYIEYFFLRFEGSIGNFQKILLFLYQS